MSIYNIIMGLMLLLFGRKLFWLFVAFSGFMVGAWFSEILIPHSSQWIQLAIALGVGIAGAVIAIMIQRVAFVLAGFFAGLYMVMMAMQAFGFNDLITVLILAGGVAGAAAGFLFIDWAIIFLSAMIGAGMIVNDLIAALRLSPLLSISAFMVLSIIGIVVQMRIMEDIAEDH